MKVQLPRHSGGEENFEIVSVNGKRDKLMKGVRVDVSAAVSEVLLHQRIAQRAAERYLERVSRR